MAKNDKVSAETKEIKEVYIKNPIRTGFKMYFGYLGGKILYYAFIATASALVFRYWWGLGLEQITKFIPGLG